MKQRLRGGRFTRDLATAGLALAVATTGRAHGSDLADRLSVPYPSGLVSAAKAGKIAWIANDHGVRNVWTARAPDFSPQLLTHGTVDDGQDLSGLRVSRDGSTLVWV